jgi:hypothetical protein
MVLTLLYYWVRELCPQLANLQSANPMMLVDISLPTLHKNLKYSDIIGFNKTRESE